MGNLKENAMRIVISLILLILFILSCNKSNSTIQIDNNQDLFKVLMFNHQGGQYICNDTFQRQEIKNDTCWAFYYNSKNNNPDFKIFVEKNSSSNGFIKYQNDKLLYHYDFVNSKSYVVNNKRYNIIKLSYSKATVDGNHDIYFNKDFGLLGLQSRAWYNWTEYKCLDDSINQIINCLQIQIYKDILFYWDLKMDNNGSLKSMHSNNLTDKQIHELLKE